MQNRNLLISILQVWGILLVVVGHSFYGVEDGNPFLYICEWFYYFHMPLFMFISGFLLKYSLKKKGISLNKIEIFGYNGLIMSRLKRLIIPYFIISSLVFIPKVLMSKYAVRPIDFSLDSFGTMLLYPWDNVIIFFWFLPTLFIIFFLFIIGNRLFDFDKNRITLIVLLIVCFFLHLFNPLESVQFLNLEGVVAYFFYFVFGFYCSNIYKEDYELSSTKLNVIALTSFLFSIIMVVIPNFLGKDIIAAVNGIILSVVLAKIYINKKYVFLNHLFGASYVIYLLSWFPQVFSQQFLTSYANIPGWLGNLLAIITGVYIPFIVYKLTVNNLNNKYVRSVSKLIGL